MYKQDYLLKVIEDFFLVLKLIIKIDVFEENSNFEKEMNELFLKTFCINLKEIDKIDLEKYSEIIHNEENRNYMIVALLKLAKYYQLKDSDLSNSYIELSKYLFNQISKTINFSSNYLETEIKELFTNLKQN